jgi:GxxExxY protein
MNQFIYKAETRSVIESCIEVHRELGGDFPVDIYKEALQIELKERKIPFQAQRLFPVRYRDIVFPEGFIADFVVFDNVLLVIRSEDELSALDEEITRNYLRHSGCPVGLLVNFNGKQLEYRKFSRKKNELPFVLLN